MLASKSLKTEVKIAWQLQWLNDFRWKFLIPFNNNIFLKKIKLPSEYLILQEELNENFLKMSIKYQNQWK